LPFELQFASFANYSSRGQNEESRKSRQLCGGIKSGAEGALSSLAKALATPAADPIRDFISEERFLVPVPGSGRTTAENFWGPKLICEALVAAGVGAGALPILNRAAGVPKSAFAAPGERPPPSRHFESMIAEVDLTTPLSLTLVDDVLTKGSTAVGAALRILHALPQADIKVFSVFRTCNLVPEITAVTQPILGRLIYQERLDTVHRTD
jgi:hypothetical protein